MAQIKPLDKYDLTKPAELLKKHKYSLFWYTGYLAKQELYNVTIVKAQNPQIWSQPHQDIDRPKGKEHLQRGWVFRRCCDIRWLICLSI